MVAAVKKRFSIIPLDEVPGGTNGRQRRYSPIALEDVSVEAPETSLTSEEAPQERFTIVPLSKVPGLIARIIVGDRGALEELYNSYAGEVFSIVLGILKDLGATEEVTQESRDSQALGHTSGYHEDANAASTQKTSRTLKPSSLGKQLKTLVVTNVEGSS